MARQLPNPKPEDPRPKARLFLVDDEPIVRKGLKLLFGGDPELEVCGEAAGEHEAVEGILALRPDMAVVDLTLKEGDGLSLIKQLHRLHPALKMLVFSMHAQTHYAAAAFAAGAQGYVMKEEGTEQLREAVQALLGGGCYLSERMAAGAPELAAWAKSRGRTRPPPS